MRYTIKVNGHTVAQVATLVVACEVGIFISRKEKVETYIYDAKILIARVIGEVITIVNKERFTKFINQTVVGE